MPSITQELARTPATAWFQAARKPQSAAARADRARCFEALAGILAERAAPREPGRRQSQPPIRPEALLSQVASRAHFSAESVYQRWRAEQNGHAFPRLAGPDRAVKPRVAFVDEAKTVSFWSYRDGVLLIADAFDMTLTEVAAAYFRALAAWACDNPPLAACDPAGPPGCVSEDMEVLALRYARRARGPCDTRALAARLTRLARHAVARVLDDTSLTPLGAFNTVRGDVVRLLTPPPDPIAARVCHSLAELADRLLHRAGQEVVLTPPEARAIQTALNGLGSLITRTVPGSLPPGGSRSPALSPPALSPPALSHPAAGNGEEGDL